MSNEWTNVGRSDSIKPNCREMIPETMIDENDNISFSCIVLASVGDYWGDVMNSGLYDIIWSISHVVTILHVAKTSLMTLKFGLWASFCASWL